VCGVPVVVRRPARSSPYVALPTAQVGLDLTQHLPLFAAFGVYVGLVSLWRLVDHARDGDRS